MKYILEEKTVSDECKWHYIKVMCSDDISECIEYIDSRYKKTVSFSDEHEGNVIDAYLDDNTIRRFRINQEG